MTSPARILIVDDEPLNVDYLEQELEGLGFATETAASGLEALERVAASPPDLVLLDVMMPGMDGISALRILKQDPETRLIPVVLMTALNAVEDRVRGIEAGADDFLSKPVDDRELVARIRTALSLKRAIDETVVELRSTSAHLERYGRQEREVAVLAIDWRLLGERPPDEALAFVSRRRRETAVSRILELGGSPTETDESTLVAIFDGPDARTRSLAAVEAASALQSSDVDPGAPEVVASLAVAVGLAAVGSARTEQPGEARWVFGAEGAPVERASELARNAAAAGLLITAAAAGLVADRFRLEPVEDGAYRVTGGAAEQQPHRVIRTILITDIVESTSTAERLGDRAWRDVVQAHDRLTRQELVRFGGQEVNTTGDGFLASFDSPAPAIRCALALVDRIGELGLRIRAGINTGEVEDVDGQPHGIALNVAVRIAASANPGEVLVAATTRDLAAGSGLVFSRRGERALKGVSEPRQVYAAVEELGAIPIRETSEGYPAGLTEREVDVLRLVAGGLTDAEAAERLYLSVRTVNAHLRSIYGKLDVRSRGAAARFARENGLV